MPTCSGGAFPQIQAALASHSSALQGLHCVRSWLPAVAGGQASSRGTAAPCPRAACSTGVAVPPPPPATMLEECLPVVTNPAESRRRLRCRQSPREIVPRAFPQPRGMGTRASLLSPLHSPHAWPCFAGALSVLGWDGKLPLDMALCRSTCKGVPSSPQGMHLEVTVLPAREAGMALVAADKERGAAANRAQNRADVGKTSPSWPVSL